jgi:hypothetical protein
MTLDDFEKEADNLKSTIMTLSNAVKDGTLRVPSQSLRSQLGLCIKLAEAVHYKNEDLRRAAGLISLNLTAERNARTPSVARPTETDLLPYPPLPDDSSNSAWSEKVIQVAGFLDGIYSTLGSERIPLLTNDLHTAVAAIYVHSHVLWHELGILRLRAGYTHAIEAAHHAQVQMRADALRKGRLRSKDELPPVDSDV